MAGTPPPDLATRIAGNDAVTDALPAVNEPVEGQPTEQAPLSEASIASLIDERLTPLQQRNTELEQELTFLRGSMQATQQVATQAVQQAARPAPAPSEPAKSYLEATPSEAIIEGLRNDPVNTILKIIDDRMGSTVKPLQERVESVGSRFQQSQQDQQFQQQALEDTRELEQDFGETFRANPEVNLLAKNIFDQLKAQVGTYVPGMLYKAASRAHQQALREGKIRFGSNGTNGNGASSPQQTLTSTVTAMRRNGSSHGIGNSPGVGGEASGSSEAKTYQDLVSQGVWRPEDAAAARKIASQWGVTEAQYVSRFMAGRRADPRFGER